MSVHKSSRKCKASYLLLIIIAVTVLLIIGFFRQLSSHIREISEYKGKEAAVEIINTSIENLLEKTSDTDYLDIERDDSGVITSISSNTAIINKISNDISHSVAKGLENIENKNIDVPVGTLSGITLFTGRGFNVPLKLHQIGAVSTKMKSEFVSSGINQTKYRLYVHIAVEVTAVLPSKSTDVKVQFDYLVNETIIVGDVPQMYLTK